MIATKLVPPKYRRTLVERERLTSRLDEESYRSLIFIKAASGFGKTALLTQWRQNLVAQGCKVGWINLDESDNEESAFLAYLMGALQKAGCDFGQGALAVYQRGEPEAMASFVTALINDLSTLEDEIYLVLEDYHCITNKAIHALIERVLAYAPTNFHLAISSRTELPFSIGQLRIHDRVVEIGAAALRFTHDETHALLAERISDKIEPERTRAFYDASEGWVAGIQMLAMSWKESSDPQLRRDASLSGRLQLSETILKSTFERLPAETTAFLLQVSIFNRFTAALCQEVIGVDNADEVLEKLASDGVMLVPLDNEARWYRFHPLFTDYLRRRLVSSVIDRLDLLHGKARAALEHNDPYNSPQFSSFLVACRANLASVDLPALHLKASAWFERHGYLIEAVQHALNAGQTGPAYDLIERCAMTVVAEGGLNTVLAWAESMPPEQLATRWRLRLAHYWAVVYSSDRESTTVEFEALADGVSVPGGITPFEYQVCRGAAACQNECSAEVLELDGLWPPTGDAFHNAITCNVLTYAAAATGNYAKVREIQAWQREKPQQVSWSLTFAYNQALVAWYTAIQGDLAAAEDMLRKAVLFADEKYGRRSSPACAVAGYLAEILYERNALGALDELLAGRLDVMNQMAFFESLVRAYQTGARLRFSRGEVKAAYDLLDQLQMYGSSKGLQRPVAAALGERIRMALLQQDHAYAQLMQQRLEDMAAPFGDESAWSKLGNGLEIPVIARLSRVRCAIAQGETAKALQYLIPLDDSPVVAMRFDMAVRVRLLRALALAAQKDSGKAAQAIVETLKITARAGMVRTYLDEGPSCAALIRSAQDGSALAEAGADGLRAHVQAILDAFETAGAAGHEAPARRRDLPAAPLPERLSAREKDVLQFLVQGMPNKRIATTMNVSIDTVKWHLKNLFSKLDVTDRLQAVDKARKADLLNH
ncbi:MAG: LuxR C-terminal-related transcriptional regulator [Pseudomonadota bacterium]